MQLEPIVSQLIDNGRLVVDFDTGMVFSGRSNTPSKPLGAKTDKGYMRICLSINGKQFHALTHRVVWCAAHGSVPDGMQIDHVNGNKADNRLSNLQCVSGAENMKLAAQKGLTNGGWRDGPRNPRTGQFVSKHAAGRLLDGREWNEYPEVANA